MNPNNLLEWLEPYMGQVFDLAEANLPAGLGLALLTGSAVGYEVGMFLRRLLGRP